MDPPTPAVAASAFERILAYGVLGPLLVLALITIGALMRRSWKKDDEQSAKMEKLAAEYAARLEKLAAEHRAELVAVHKERTADAHATVGVLTSAAKDSVATLSATTGTLQGIKEGMSDLKDELRTAVDEMRTRGRRP